MKFYTKKQTKNTTNPLKNIHTSTHNHPANNQTTKNDTPDTQQTTPKPHYIQYTRLLTNTLFTNNRLACNRTLTIEGITIAIILARATVVVHSRSSRGVCACLVALHSVGGYTYLSSEDRSFPFFFGLPPGETILFTSRRRGSAKNRGKQQPMVHGHGLCFLTRGTLHHFSGVTLLVRVRGSVRFPSPTRVRKG